jgi:hypothetical protein
MSFVTTIILMFSKSENEEERIKEVNQFAYRGESIGLCSIEDAVGGIEMCYGMVGIGTL